MTTVNFNYPKFRYTIASTGQPGAGYKLFTYEEGTSTKKTTWTSLAKTAENTNPIILDANGEADVWIDGTYKFVLAPSNDTDPPTSPVWTYDAIRSDNGGSSTSPSATGSVSLINGSFEVDTDGDGVPDNWNITAYTGGTVALDSTSSSHGGNSLKFTSTGSGGGMISTTDYYEVESGNAIGVNFSIISADATTLNKVQVYWYDGSQVFLSSTDVYNNGTTNPTSWARLYKYVKAPATAKYARIVVIGVDPTSTTHSSTNFDNLEIDVHSDKNIVSVTVTPSSDADVTLTSAQYSVDRIVLADGSWTSGHNIIFPTDERRYYVDNSAGTYNAVAKTSTGTGITVPAGTSICVACDGTNIVEPLSAYVKSSEVLSSIQPITASVSANALTVTLNETTLDFRSSTLGSGTVNRRTVSTPISMTVSSGSTLGTVNGVKSRIVVLAIDNAGTVELAVVNISGGNNLDETTRISTTAEGGAGGADSATTIYSTTARTNVPFRVVGFVESTQAIAGTWATDPSTIQGAGGNAFTAFSSGGYGQTWQDMTASRAASTTYYNDTGRPIDINVRAQSSVGFNPFSISITINGYAIGGQVLYSDATGTSYATAYARIPPGQSYSVAISLATINKWSELR